MNLRLALMVAVFSINNLFCGAQSVSQSSESAEQKLKNRAKMLEREDRKAKRQAAKQAANLEEQSPA